MHDLLNEQIGDPTDDEQPDHDFDAVDHSNCNYADDGKGLQIDVDKILGATKDEVGPRIRLMLLWMSLSALLSALLWLLILMLFAVGAVVVAVAIALVVDIDVAVAIALVVDIDVAVAIAPVVNLDVVVAILLIVIVGAVYVDAVVAVHVVVDLDVVTVAVCTSTSPSPPKNGKSGKKSRIFTVPLFQPPFRLPPAQIPDIEDYGEYDPSEDVELI